MADDDKRIAALEAQVKSLTAFQTKVESMFEHMDHLSSAYREARSQLPSNLPPLSDELREEIYAPLKETSSEEQEEKRRAALTPEQREEEDKKKQLLEQY